MNFRFRLAIHCSSVRSSRTPPGELPAHVTRMSMRPNFFSVALTHRSTSSLLLMSPAMPMTSVPLIAAISLAATCSGSSLRAVRTTFAPSLASPSATARPIPLLAPVTKATLSLRLRSMGEFCSPQVTSRAEARAVQLAHSVARQLVELEHALGAFVRREQAMRVRDQGGLVESRSILHHHPGSHLLAPLGAGHPGHGRLSDRGMLLERELDLAWVDVEPPGDDHVLRPASDGEGACRLVEGADVAGAKPAVRPERRWRGRIVSPVAAEHLRPAQLDLAVVRQSHLHPGQRQPDRVRECGIARVAVDLRGVQAALGRAISDERCLAQRELCTHGDRAAQLRGAAHA